MSEIQRRAINSNIIDLRMIFKEIKELKKEIEQLKQFQRRQEMKN